MTRIKSFDAPHKGLRSALSKFSFLAGKTNYADLEQLAELKKTGNELFILLNDHVHTENEFVLKPLEERVPGAGRDQLHQELFLPKALAQTRSLYEHGHLTK